MLCIAIGCAPSLALADTASPRVPVLVVLKFEQPTYSSAVRQSMQREAGAILLAAGVKLDCKLRREFSGD